MPGPHVALWPLTFPHRPVRPDRIIGPLPTALCPLASATALNYQLYPPSTIVLYPPSPSATLPTEVGYRGSQRILENSQPLQEGENRD
jgi:hypothetical protein